MNEKKLTLQSSHFFYVAFFEASQVKGVDDLIGLFGKNVQTEEFHFGRPIEKLIRLRLPLEIPYGTDPVMDINKLTIRGKTFFLYDLYMSKQIIDRKAIYSISFPYKKLSSFIDNILLENSIERIYYVPLVDKVLDYMKGRGEEGHGRVEKQGFKMDITKYSASVKESANAKKVNLVGDSPLNSRIYDVLSNDKRITIKPVSLKMKCTNDKIGEFEVSFDKLGNYRYWLRKNAQSVALPLLVHAFEFFWDQACLEESNLISKHTYLEDE